MFDVAFSEILFTVILAIILLGPDRLPEAGKQLGKLYRQWHSLKNNFQREWRDGFSYQTDDSDPTFQKKKSEEISP